MFIFDFDGTIANTEVFHFQVWNDILSGYGVVLTEEDFLRYIGKKDDVILPMVEKEFNIKIENYEDFGKKRVEIFIQKYLPKIKPYSYFSKFYKNDPEMCIVSNQFYDIIYQFFKFNNLKMPPIYSATKLGTTKQKLITEFKEKYGDITVYEDVNTYLEFAKSIGCKTVGIEYRYNLGTLVDADKIIKGE